MYNRQYFSPLLLAYLASDKLNCVHDASTELPGGVFIGNLEAAQSIETLKKHSIRAVLTVADGTNLSYKKEPYVQDHLILLADDVPTFDMTKHFNAGIEFIQGCRKKGSNILVHCHAGISRSSTMVLAYLMKTIGWPLEKCLSEVRKRRPIVQPNPGFLRQLSNFQKKIKEGKDVGNKPTSTISSSKKQQLTSSKRPASLVVQRGSDKYSQVKQRQKNMQQQLNDLLINKSFQPKASKIEQKSRMEQKKQERKVDRKEWGREIGRSEPKISKTSKDPFRPKDVPLLPTRNKLNYHFTQKGFNTSDNMKGILNHNYGLSSSKFSGKY